MLIIASCDRVCGSECLFELSDIEVEWRDGVPVQHVHVSREELLHSRKCLAQLVEQLARRMVSEWGMGEQTGPVVYDLASNSPYLNQQPLEDHNRVYSEATAQRLDSEVEQLITQAHQQARSVLTEHRDALERLEQALLQEEVIERDQILAIVNGAQKTQGGAGGDQASQR